MAKIFVGIGSNLGRKKHITHAMDALKYSFGPLAASSIYESEAVGFVGPPFYNLVVSFFSELSPAAINEHLGKIEQQLGPLRHSPSFCSRTLDLDLLLYDDLIILNRELELPRRDILQYAFILCPLAEIAGSTLHPQLQQTYSELWNKFKKDTTVLRKAALDLRVNLV